jgi:putative phage-type endonuclease
MDHQIWLEKRRGCITGTDIAALMGVSPYKTLTGVWLDKKGLSGELADNEAMYWGRALEDVIARRYTRDTGQELLKGSFMQKGVVGGTIDFLAPDIDRIIEIKTAGIRQAIYWGDSNLELVPTQYLCQVQWYLGLHNKEKADIAVLIAGNDYRVYPITFNPELFKMMRDVAEDFWSDYIVGNKEPAPDGSDDYNAYLKHKNPFNNGLIAEPTEDIRLLCMAIASIKAETKKLESELECHEQKVKSLIGDLDGYKDSSLTVTWKKSKDSEKTDWKGIAEELIRDNPNEYPSFWENLVKQHTKINEGSRRLYLKVSEKNNTI